MAAENFFPIRKAFDLFKIAPFDFERPQSLLTVRSTISQDLARGHSSMVDTYLASFIKELHPLALRSDPQGFGALYSSASYSHPLPRPADFVDDNFACFSTNPKSFASLAGSHIPDRLSKQASKRDRRIGYASMKRSRSKNANAPSQDNLNKRLKTREERAEARNPSGNVEKRCQASHTSPRLMEKVDEDQEKSSMAGSVSYAQHGAKFFPSLPIHFFCEPCLKPSSIIE